MVNFAENMSILKGGGALLNFKILNFVFCLSLYLIKMIHCERRSTETIHPLYKHNSKSLINTNR